MRTPYNKNTYQGRTTVEWLAAQAWSNGKVGTYGCSYGASLFFQPGHRIRVQVSSSNFPRWDRNLGTGGNNFDETTWVAQRNLVHHSAKYPSHILLPVIPSSSSTFQSYGHDGVRPARDPRRNRDIFGNQSPRSLPP